MKDYLDTIFRKEKKPIDIERIYLKVENLIRNENPDFQGLSKSEREEIESLIHKGVDNYKYIETPNNRYVSILKTSFRVGKFFGTRGGNGSVSTTVSYMDREGNHVVKEQKYSITKENCSGAIDGDSVLYADFINNISKSDRNISLKVFNGEIEVTSGNVLVGMQLKIYYGDQLLKTFDIVTDYVKFDESFIVDEDNMIVSNIESGMNIAEFKSKISTNGTMNILDKDGNIIEESNSKLKTGDKIKVVFSKKTEEYKISINGDVNGDGLLNDNDVSLVSSYLVKGNVIVGNEYLLSADIDHNNKIDINDVIKMERYINEQFMR